jgi:phage gp36-like protein
VAYYTTEADLERAAGGAARLTELRDLDGDGTADAGVMEAAQARADAWINAHTWKLHSGRLPYDPVPDFVRELAAEETVYRLRLRRGIETQQDRDDRAERRDELEAMRAGETSPNATEDTYPIGDGGGTPCAVERTSTTDPNLDDFGRDSTKGFW